MKNDYKPSAYKKSLYTKHWLDYKKSVKEIQELIKLKKFQLTMTPDTNIKIKKPNSQAGRITQE